MEKYTNNRTEISKIIVGFFFYLDIDGVNMVDEEMT